MRANDFYDRDVLSARLFFRRDYHGAFFISEDI
jgi:hypothetical protein